LGTLPIEARRYLEATRYAAKQQVAVTLDATEHDVTFTDRPEFAYRNPNVAPVVSMNWLTSHGVEPLPGQSDFKTGFRVIFGAPAPASAVLNYQVLIVP
jgi:hypothetical protein